MTPEQQAMDLNPELLDVNRQRKLAELLMVQGLQQPQGQMISGRYVAPSTAQQLNPLANILAGQAVGNRADKSQLDYANALRGKQQQEIAQFGELLKVDPNKAYQFAAQSQVSQLREAGLKKMMPQEFDLNEGAKRYMAMPDGTIKEIASGGAKYRAPLQADTGTFIEYRDPNDPTKVLARVPKTMSPEATARMADEGVGGYGGMGQPTGQRTGQIMPQGQAPSNNNTLSVFQPDPMLTPKQNRELAAKFSEKQRSQSENAKDSFDLMKSAGSILASNAPSSGALSNALTYAGEIANLPFGARKQESEADAQLKMLSGALTMKQPRFEGPQGVLDVTLYQKLAGDLGNANIPVESRLATMKQMVNLQKKYYPNADWDSIDTKLKDSGKVSLGAPKEIEFNSLPTGRR